MDFESGGVVQVDAPPPSVERQQRVEDEIEQRWQQVEKTPIREERRVPLPSTQQSRDTSELEKLVESYKKGVRHPKSNAPAFKIKKCVVITSLCAVDVRLKS